jgi:hypothetical protein
MGKNYSKEDHIIHVFQYVYGDGGELPSVTIIVDDVLRRPTERGQMTVF